jgi:hypothetical protein
MRLHRVFLTVALATALVAGPTAHADLKYRAEIVGAEGGELADLLDSIAELKTLEDKVPASEEALRRRPATSAGSPMPRTASAIGMRNSLTTSTPSPSRQRWW